jgi:short-subunit dehydrogenase involved in D-alanine esterification of teichoic acids
MRTPQQAIGSGFGSASTAVEVIKGTDLTGTIAILTGGYADLGLETVRVLSSAGASAIVPARSFAKAATALKDISNVEMKEMNLVDSDSIDACADKFLTSGMPLHILVNSAGIMAVPRLTFDATRRMGGVYCENVEVARVAPIEESSMFAIDDARRKVGVMPYAIDPESAERLWHLSEQFIRSAQ